MQDFQIIERYEPLFKKDLNNFDEQISEVVRNSRFLVMGGGGTIGQAVTIELFKRQAKAIHVIDLNENYLVELVRDIRSSFGYLVNDFDTFAIDCGSEYFETFLAKGRYDFVLNLSAMKHVRSENSPYSMFRMLETNVINTLKTYVWSKRYEVKKYFCVSTDKASNPANFMGATKRAMELCLMQHEPVLPVSGARFANVAFSNGSLLDGFRFRISKSQPLSAPSDISRFFISKEESGIICLFATILGKSNEILFPYNDKEIKLITFKNIAENFLRSIGKEPILVYDETEARELINKVDLEKFWPLNCFHTDTAGEKPFEEFFSKFEDIDYGTFEDLASILFFSDKTDADISDFIAEILDTDLGSENAREHLLNIIGKFVPTFQHLDSKKFLNSRM